MGETEKPAADELPDDTRDGEVASEADADEGTPAEGDTQAPADAADDEGSSAPG